MPISVFRFPSVASTRYFSDRTAAKRSLVVVFPLLPVTATTGPQKCLRSQEARASRALSVSSTAMAVTPSGSSIAPRCERSTRTAGAPLRTASPINRWASKRSPMMGTKSSPGCKVRLSVETPQNAVCSAVLHDCTADCRGQLFSAERLHDRIAPLRRPEPLRGHRSACARLGFLGRSRDPCLRSTPNHRAPRF